MKLRIHKLDGKYTDILCNPDPTSSSGDIIKQFYDEFGEMVGARTGVLRIESHLFNCKNITEIEVLDD